MVDDQLKALMDYTKFHIGMYTTLCTLLVAIIGLNGLNRKAVGFLPYLRCGGRFERTFPTAIIGRYKSPLQTIACESTKSVR
jgi:hypothetical protein